MRGKEKKGTNTIYAEDRRYCMNDYYAIDFSCNDTLFFPFATAFKSALVRYAVIDAFVQEL